MRHPSLIKAEMRFARLLVGLQLRRLSPLYSLATLALATSTLAGAAGCTSHNQPGNPAMASACDAVDLQTDEANCGCCANACPDGMWCRGGRCDGTTLSFFVFGDMHSGPSQNDANIAMAASQMQRIDPNPIAIFSNGDLVDTGSEAQWVDHDAMVSQSGWRSQTACAASFGVPPRYLGAVGDHDIMTNNWDSAWNKHLPAQNQVGRSNSGGVYYSLAFATTLFVVLDNENIATAVPATAEPETTWLATVLAASTAPLKFLFFHEPVYPCNGRHEPLAAALPWVGLAEESGVNVVFNSHTHVYTRTCAKRGGFCVADDAGVVFVETGPIGATPREVDVTTSAVSGTDIDGNARTDSYDCVVGQQLRAAVGDANTFCHVSVDGSAATVRCYFVGGNDAPFDTFTVSR